jgi:hypothetical protein
MKDIEIVKSLLSSQLGAYDELIYGSKVGNMDIVKSAISKGAKCWNSALLNACRGGNIDIVELMFSMCEKSGLNPDITELSKCLYNACECGHTHIVEYIISKADNKLIWDSGFHGACSGGNLELVEYMISKIEAPEYKNNLKYGFYNACENGHMDVIKYGIYKPNWNDGLIGACKGGHKNIVEFIFSKTNLKRFNIKIAFLQACSNGHMDIVLFIISKTNIYFDWDLELYHACLSGNLELIEFIISKGAAYNHNGFIHACLYGYIDVVKLFISRFGIYDIDYIIELLMKGENKDIIRLLISNGAVSKENYTNVFEIDIGMFSSVANSDLVDYVVNFL